MAGGNPNIYAYTKDVNAWIDPFGLDCEVVNMDGHATVYDKNGKFAGHGWLDGDELNLLINTSKSDLRGSEVFNSIFDYINKEWDEIGSIRGTWRPGSLGDNFDSYMKTKNAFETFTGKMAKRKGFDKVTVNELKDGSGNIIGIDAFFK